MDKDIKEFFIMDKDNDIDLRQQMDQDSVFQDFWQSYRPDEIRFPNRRLATYRLWRTRLPAARQAMLAYVKDNDIPKWKNPYFFVNDFRDPDPTNYNGHRPPNEPCVIAIYKGAGGVYTLREALAFNMIIKSHLS